jgi:hypothetical protein
MDPDVLVIGDARSTRAGAPRVRSNIATAAARTSTSIRATSATAPTSR